MYSWMLPSLLGDTSREIMASHRERVMEKTGKFQIVYAGLTNLCQYYTAGLARDMMTNGRKQSACSVSVLHK